MSEAARNAADSLKYRDFLTVMLILKERHRSMTTGSIFTTRARRSAGSKTFVPGHLRRCSDPEKACYGLEYFCFEHDGLWDLLKPT